MKLYVDSTGHWAGTKADAKRDAALTGAEWDAREVPTDKAGLIEWLNDHWADRPADQTVVAQTEAAETIRAAADGIDEERRAKFDHNIRIEDEIANASFADAIRLAEHANSRVVEHVRYAKARLGMRCHER